MNVVIRLESLRSREHTATVDIIEGLLELKATQEYLALGYSTVWDFLVEHLKYSNAAASRRYKAMKCAEKFPQVLTMLREHRTSLSALAQAERTLAEAEDAEQLLAEIDGQSARRVERAVARRNPASPKKETVRRKYVRKKTAKVVPAGDLFDRSAESVASHPVEPALERIMISFSLSPDDFEDFERVKAILSRKHPEGVSVETVFQELVTFFLKHKGPKRPRNSKKQSSSPKGATSRNPRQIPKRLRDEVYTRDQGRCTYRGERGHRCNSTHNLQIDHVQPIAVGGRTELANLRLLCANHNRYRARDLLPTRKWKSSEAAGAAARNQKQEGTRLPK